MRILIDLDDTLVDMMHKALYYYNEWPGRSIDKIQFNQLASWDLPDRDVFEAIWRIPGFFADLPWMDGDAPGVLGALKEDGHEIVIVSAIPSWESPKDKYQWCHTHLKIPGLIDSMDQVVLTRGKKYVQGDIMVDDKPDNLVGRRQPILFSRPWNKSTKGYGRVHDWQGVYHAIQDAVILSKYGTKTYFMGGTL